MPIPVTVYVDTGETLLSVAQVSEVLADLATIFAMSALITGEDHPDSGPLEIYLSRAVVGSLWTEFLVHPETLAGAQAAGTFIGALTGAPFLASLPQRIRAQWYRRAAEAEVAKLAYLRAREKGRIFAQQGQLDEMQARTTRQRRRPGTRKTTKQD